MTLVELLVAFMVLLMLVGALVSLTTSSLETWTAGEARKDIYDRAQTVLDAVSSDLRNVYVESELWPEAGTQVQSPLLGCDLDKNRNPRIRFVRTGNPAVVRVPPSGQPQRIVPPMYYGAFWEVAYVMDPDPTRNTLHRGVRAFDRRISNNLLKPPAHYGTTDALWASFREVESGVLWVGYRFWTQYTNTWAMEGELGGAPVRKVAPTSRERSGPERIWDSTRMDRKFFFHRKLDIANPDFVYPEIVQVSVTIESGAPETHGIRLAQACDERSSAIPLTHTQGLPDAPGLVKIEGEWIEYGFKGTTELGNLRRGQRQTAAGGHAAGLPVHFGETFTTEVRLNVYREAQEP
jgi:hypothetical protein